MDKAQFFQYTSYHGPFVHPLIFVNCYSPFPWKQGRRIVDMMLIILQVSSLSLPYMSNRCPWLSLISPDGHQVLRGHPHISVRHPADTLAKPLPPSFQVKPLIFDKRIKITAYCFSRNTLFLPHHCYYNVQSAISLLYISKP